MSEDDAEIFRKAMTGVRPLPRRRVPPPAPRPRAIARPSHAERGSMPREGLRSGPGGPVLKHAVNDWLSRIENVSAFASARPVDGGTGAVYVLLRLPPAPPRPHRE